MSFTGSPLSWRGEDWSKPGMSTFNIDAEMERRQNEVVEWLKSLFPDLNISLNASEEELRASLIDGTVFLGILKRFIPENADENKNSYSESRLENIRRFCAAVEQMGLPSFKVSELEQGPISAVIYCLWSLRDHLNPDLEGDKSTGSPVTSARKAWKAMEKSPLESSEMLQEGNQIGQSSRVLGVKARPAILSEPRLRQVLRGSVMSEPTTPQSHQGGNKFHEVFQLRQGRYRDLPAAKISEMMKSNSLDNAPTQSLLSVVNGILEESIERKNGEIPNRVACLLKKVLQEVERRISTQAEHIRNQNNLIKAREEKYQSRIKVLETLATGPSEETQIIMSQLQMLKTEKSKIEEMKKLEQADVAKLMKENESSTLLISELKRDLENMKKSYENRFEQVKMEVGKPQTEVEKQLRETEQQLKEREQQLMKENETNTRLISELKRDLVNMKRSYENQFDQVKVEVGKPQTELEQQLMEAEQQLRETKQQLREKEQQFMKENETSTRLISELKCDFENMKRLYENRFDQVKVEDEKPQIGLEQQLRETEQQLKERELQLMKENETSARLISELKLDLENMKRLYGNRFDQVKVEAEKPQTELEQQLKETEQQLRETEQQLKERELQLMKENETSARLISKLKLDLENMKRLNENKFDQVKLETEKPQTELEQQLKATEQQLRETEQQLKEREQQMMKEKETSTRLISELKCDLENMKKLYKNQFDQVKVEYEKPQIDLEQQLRETEQQPREREQQLIKENEISARLISELKLDLENMKILNENKFDQVKLETEKSQTELEQQLKATEQQLRETEQQLREREQQMMKEKETSTRLISELKCDLENMKKLYKNQFDQVKVESGKPQIDLEQQLRETEQQLRETEQQLREREQQLMKENEISTMLISKLKLDIENMKKSYENQFEKVKVEAGKPQIELELQLREKEQQLMKENETSSRLISELKLDLENMKISYENQFEQVKLEAGKPQIELEQQLREIEQQLTEREQQLMKENETSSRLISELKLDLENMKTSYDNQFVQVKLEAEKPQIELEQQLRETEQQLRETEQQLMMENKTSSQLISELKLDLENMKRSYENQFEQVKLEAEKLRKTEQQLRETESVLEQTRKRINDLETASESKLQNWNKKLYIVDNFMRLQSQSLEELRFSSDTIKHEVIDTGKNWSKELASLGQKMKVLTDIAKTYHKVLAENRRMYNEIQELRGNIRVYCRVRPFLPGENRKQSTVECIGDNGEIVIANPSKPGREAQKAFTFNKVFGQTATQEEVYLDTQPLVRSVLDGYNVCIFAYGQTGAGKTYTMTGPNSATEKEWGVNYRALNDLFEISRNRKDTFTYEVSVQMVEIYNEQVRDLLAHDAAPKKLGVLVTSQPNGIAVPDACMQIVASTSDVLDLMHIGLNNRAMSSTALNERSSRSHSILTVHVRGVDVNTGSTLRGSLHLVDLAGSERVDRSEVTGERLKEAQHINKSLSALGDVIFALSQKSNHIPYRNSKLTQVLQSSLGGHAKTLMFVQINPDVGSYSESVSTLKFAERVAGVELGAAKSQKEGKDIKDLIEQVASLKDTIAMKDEEIEHLQLHKESRSRPGIIKSESHTTHEYKELISQQRLSGGDADNSSDAEILGLGDADSEDQLSEMSDGALSLGTETEGSISSVSEPNTPRQGKPSQIVKEKRSRVPTQVLKTSSAIKTSTATASRSRLKETITRSTSTKKPGTSQGNTPSSKPVSRR